ncbi:hypothetical protein GTA08_BOTSDO07411 [Neofusicoccum parvum]|uniref:Uncharacterized protein n=2 Tax=Neofusicoccum parvum TaxID=310453 RepID=A0ACB5RT93_9PEZI|nr:hypothetical protein GTA08_BOTSDO07411 [Neofusicoccum parvum]
MKSSHATTMLAGAIATTASAFECTQSAFEAVIPSNTSVSLVQDVAQNGTFEVPASDIAYPTSPTGLRALCAVQIKVPAPGNTTYEFGLFLPDEWNGRFLAVGNGGFAGGINWEDMGAGVGYGFAVVSTDTGHNSTALDAKWAYNELEELENWGYRALHGSVVLGKQIVENFYGEAPAFNYYTGCSAGGKQGFKEVEEFPDDFDGVVAGAPAWWTSHLQLWNGKVGLYNLPVDAPYRLNSSHVSALAAEVLKQCDPQDGVTDSIIQDPTRCRFVPETLLCTSNATNTSTCLNAAQIQTVYQLYNDWVIGNQSFVFPHFQLGSEAQWDLLVLGDAPSTLMTDYVQYMLQLGPDWDWRTDWDDEAIVALSDAINPGNATADNYDLGPFHARGGKLLHYHGYADGSIATGSSVYLYNKVTQTLRPRGVDVDEFYRFFLVPGMQHCSGTPDNMNAPWYFAGPNQASVLGSDVHSVPGFSDPEHDVLLAMMAWVENGTAPTQIIGTKFDNDTVHDTVLRQRPLCVYPKQAKYDGSGDVDSADSWTCESLY